MRSALLVALVLAGCATPTGNAVPECDATWREVESVVVTPAAGDSETIAIDCMRRIDESRVRIGFLMPPGPTCYQLSAVDVVEAADVVAITLSVVPVDDPLAGACSEEETRTATEIDLQAPVADRELLDGSAS